MGLDDDDGQNGDTTPLTPNADLALPTLVVETKKTGLNDVTPREARSSPQADVSSDKARASPTHRSGEQQRTSSSRNDGQHQHRDRDRVSRGSHRTSGSSSKTARECICGKGVACLGMTQAFRLLGDPRSYYVELPRYRKDPPAYKYVFRNNLRSAYLRHMARSNDKIDIDMINESPKRRFVALHHFHPTVVRAFYENPLTSAQKHKVPISITEHELKELDMEVLQEDQILSASGMPTGGYYFVPSYPQAEAHHDLKTLIQAVRTSRQHQQRQKSDSQQRRHHRRHRGSGTGDDGDDGENVPTNIEITSSTTPSTMKKPSEDTKATVNNLPSPPPEKKPAVVVPPPITVDDDGPTNQKQQVVVEEKSVAAPPTAATAVAADNIPPTTSVTTDEAATGHIPPASSAAAASIATATAAAGVVIMSAADQDRLKQKDDSEVPPIVKDDEMDKETLKEKEREVVTDENDDVDDVNRTSNAAAAAMTRTVVVGEDEDKDEKPVVEEDDSDDSSTNEPIVVTTSGENEKAEAEAEDSNKIVDLMGGDDALADHDDFDQIWNKDPVADIPTTSPSSDVVEEISPSKKEKDDDAFDQIWNKDPVADIPRTSPSSDVVEEISHSKKEKDEDDFDQIWNKDPVAKKEKDEDDFDHIWNKDPVAGIPVPSTSSDMMHDGNLAREIESDVLMNQTILEEEEEEEHTEGNDDEIEPKTKDSKTDDQNSQQNDNNNFDDEETATTIITNVPSLASRRDADRPWATPKYRRAREDETTKRLSVSATDYIDPNDTGDLTTRLSSSFEVDEGDEVARIAADMTIFRQKENDEPPPSPPRRTYTMPSSSPKGLSPSTRQGRGIKITSSTDDESTGSNDAIDAIDLTHQLPGCDPTLRIQIHNDLIAWESKRRSDLSQTMEYHREQWTAACDILREGMAEARFAERLILGISKASRLFADSLQAVYDDKLFDDRGNTVKNSFLQNRLAKKRSAFEYSIESSQAEDAGQAGQSMLLGSILEVQLEVAKAFIESSEHLDQEILPEVLELKDELYRDSQGLEAKGDSIIQELKRSEIEVKGIWDVFDAMVTGDLMEYSVHGSMHGSTHGGSSHGGSYHGGSYHSSLTGGSGSSVHGFLTARGENEAPIVSSASSPLVKGTFKQLGSIEDGWLIEMYYKSAVAYQRSVFGVAEMELRNLFQEIISLEERRFRRLHQVMLAFAPRQRRLFNKLPEQLKTVLENLVGLRIDEESLQKVIDESIRDRSRDHLRGLTAHKSSIMNRSRVNAMEEAATTEVDEIEKTFGNPFASPMILLSKVVELKPTGLKGLVNNAWRPSLAVVTSEGNLLIFETTEAATTPTEAFKSLYPPMNFDNPSSWLDGRKAEIVKSLTPTVSLKLTKSTIVVSRMQKRQLEIAEENTQQVRAGARFMNAVKTGGVQQSKCTLRISSASDAAEWMNLLERTKKVLNSSNGKGSRFRF